MMINFRYLANIYFISSFFVSCYFLVGCDETEGIDGLEVGMSKSLIVETLIKNGIDSVEPVVNKVIQVKNYNKEKLPSLINAPGLCIQGNSGFSFQLYFSVNNKPIINYISVSASQYDSEISKLETRKETVEYIKQIMENHSNISVSNCIINVGIMKLIDFQHKTDLRLNEYDSWFYYVPNSYSTVTLRFSNGILEKIEYNMRRHEKA